MLNGNFPDRNITKQNAASSSSNQIKAIGAQSSVVCDRPKKNMGIQELLLSMQSGTAFGWAMANAQKPS